MPINDTERETLINTISPDLHDEAAVDAFARIGWSVIAEPADGSVGQLIDHYGASEALRLVQGKIDRYADYRQAVRKVSGDDGLLERLEARFGSGDFDARISNAIRAGARHGMTFITPTDSRWPPRMNDLGRHAPLGLWVRGDASVLSAQHSLNMVGARAATGYGEHVTIEIAAGLVDRGVAIVSGGAYGIDGAAHRAALASGGRTAAFLAGGLDRLYPAGHEALLGRIVDNGGALASEVPPGTAPTKWRFLQRNRLLACAAPATLVVEASRRSGSLNTAGHALALDRRLGGVPGPITSSASTGVHELLREHGATVVTSADDAYFLVRGKVTDAELDPPTPQLIASRAELAHAGTGVSPAVTALGGTTPPRAGTSTMPSSTEIANSVRASAGVDGIDGGIAR